MLTPWSEMIPKSEGNYLKSSDLQEIESYALSFAKCCDIYQVFQSKEAEWIAHVLQTLGYSPAGDLERPACLIAEQLAYCLRLVGICLITHDVEILRHQESGKMEDYLNLSQALRHLYAEIKISLSPDELVLIDPFWQSLISLYKIKEAATDASTDPPLTVAELFV